MCGNRRAALAVSIIILISILLPHAAFTETSAYGNCCEKMSPADCGMQTIVDSSDNYVCHVLFTAEKTNCFTGRQKQTLKNTLRLSIVLCLLMTFFFGFIRKRVLFSYIYLCEFHVAHFLQELIVRLEKDGKKRETFCF